jgi:lauroyl/myristoyl acyltransferase
MVENLEEVALHYATLYRHGRSELLAQTVLDTTLETEHERLSKKGQGVIIVVPHCAAAVLSSARLSTFCQTVLLVREPKDIRRCELMLAYLRKLGPELILTRTSPPATVMRNIARALRQNKVLVGTTDLLNSGRDTIHAQAFGQSIYCPAWPARISGRFGVPILPGYIHMNGQQIALIADQGYVDSDMSRCTQRWMSSFERRFRQYPSDWVFMLDKRWARILAGAPPPDAPSSARDAGLVPREPCRESQQNEQIKDKIESEPASLDTVLREVRLPDVRGNCSGNQG